MTTASQQLAAMWYCVFRIHTGNIRHGGHHGTHSQGSGQRSHDDQGPKPLSKGTGMWNMYLICNI
jgi:hypothetical protein